MADGAKPTGRKNGNWLLWWMVGTTELRRQVDGYHQLKVYQSARGITLLLFVATSVVTAAVIEVVSHDRSGYLDMAILLGLGVFIYLGHRWAMIGAMVFWTLEKVLQTVQTVQSGAAFTLVPSLIFWAIYMHAMFLAFRVEQTRRQAPPLDPSVFD